MQVILNAVSVFVNAYQCPFSWHPLPPSLPFNLLCPPPYILPSFPNPLPSSPLDNADADREQCTARRPAGWGHSWPWCRGTWWWRRGSGPMARGWNKRRNKPRGSGHLWARNGSSRTVRSLFCHSLFLSPKRPPSLLYVWARGSPWPHGPWSPSPGLPSSPPTAPQHSQCKLELRQNLPSCWPRLSLLGLKDVCESICDLYSPSFFVSEFLIVLLRGSSPPI